MYRHPDRDIVVSIDTESHSIENIDTGSSQPIGWLAVMRWFSSCLNCVCIPEYGGWTASEASVRDIVGGEWKVRPYVKEPHLLFTVLVSIPRVMLHIFLETIKLALLPSHLMHDNINLGVSRGRVQYWLIECVTCGAKLLLLCCYVSTVRFRLHQPQCGQSLTWALGTVMRIRNYHGFSSQAGSRESDSDSQAFLTRRVWRVRSEV